VAGPIHSSASERLRSSPKSARHPVIGQSEANFGARGAAVSFLGSRPRWRLFTHTDAARPGIFSSKLHRSENPPWQVSTTLPAAVPVLPKSPVGG